MQTKGTNLVELCDILPFCTPFQQSHTTLLVWLFLHCKCKKNFNSPQFFLLLNKNIIFPYFVTPQKLYLCFQHKKRICYSSNTFFTIEILQIEEGRYQKSPNAIRKRQKAAVTAGLSTDTCRRIAGGTVM